MSLKLKFDPEYDYGQTDLSVEENLACWKFAQLITTLITLSSSSDRQAEIIGIGATCDEMGEDFHSYFTLSSRSYHRAGLLSEKEILELEKLDAYFEERSGNNSPDFWDDFLLDTNPEWDVVRTKATNILQLLGFQDLTIDFDRKEDYEITDKGKRVVGQWTKTRLVKK
ncbi:hypothetical protein [Polluticoccus soli]|uniref:hypothetical protein n=1 Tax=Polluticoccus soli TaxID=3034150 RepID=UPI0023E18F36|nr:hypothetical protein [Flavipsychrobacter sp. JY13-12]